MKGYCCPACYKDRKYLNEGGKAVSEFKVGDRVECIDVSSRGGVNPNNYITLGNIYVIERINGLRLKLKDVGDGGSTFTPDKDRFKLAGQSNKIQTTKENSIDSNVLAIFGDKVKGNELVVIDRHFTPDMLQRILMETHHKAIQGACEDAEAKRLEKEEKEVK